MEASRSNLTAADVYLLPLAERERFLGLMERRCRRKLTRKLPSIKPLRRIVPLLRITERANTIRATISQRRLTKIQARHIAIQPPPTEGAGNTARRNSSDLPGQNFSVRPGPHACWPTVDIAESRTRFRCNFCR